MWAPLAWRVARVALVGSLLLSLAASSALARPPASPTTRPRLDPIAARRALETVLAGCVTGTGHVSVTREHRRTEIHVTGASSATCHRIDYRFLPEPPPGARVRYELDVVNGIVRLVGMRTENTGGRPPPR